MPEDIKDEVSEQEQDQTMDEESPVNEEDLTDEQKELKAGFEEEADIPIPEKEPKKRGRPPKEKAAPKEEENKSPLEKKAEPTGEEKEKTESEEKEKSTEEADEDVKRGQELLKVEEIAAEKKRSDEARARDESARRDQEARLQEQAKQGISSDFLAGLHQALPGKAKFPEKVQVGDTVLDFKTFLEDNPEATSVAGVVADAAIQEYVRQGVLMTAGQHQQEIKKLRESYDDRLWLMDLKVELAGDGIKNPVGLYGDKDFKGWYGKQGKEIQALMTSTPEDAAKVFRRYMKEKGLAEADTKKKEADAKAKEKKDRVDRIFGTTTRAKASGPASKDLGSLTPEDEMKAGFEEEDED